MKHEDDKLKKRLAQLGFSDVQDVHRAWSRHSDLSAGSALWACTAVNDRGLSVDILGYAPKSKIASASIDRITVYFEPRSNEAEIYLDDLIK